MKKIAILFGGNSSEHEVSCKSAKSIIEQLDHKKFDAVLVGITKKNEWYQYQDQLSFLEEGKFEKAQNLFRILDIVAFLKRFDIVFPIVHGTSGEDGKLQGMLDLFQIPYVGCKTLASAIGMDKAMTKIIAEKENIPVAPYRVITKTDYDLKELEEQFSYPLMVKPCNGGSSIGISKVHNRKELKKAINLAYRYDSKLLIEQFIQGQELECAILGYKGIKASIVGEILPANEFYDYDAKYQNEASETLIPARIPKIVQEEIGQYAIQLFQALGGKGYARVDFFYDSNEDQIYFNEINTIPGFTSISMYPKLWQYDGISYSSLLTKLIYSELR